MATQSYRPRLQTNEERDKDKEKAKKKKQWQEGRRRFEQETMMSRSNQLNTSEAGFAFKDSVIGPGRGPGQLNSRTSLDASAFQSRQYLPLGGTDTNGVVPSLRQICIYKFANEYGNASVIAGLTSEHRLAVPDLLDALGKTEEKSLTQEELTFMRSDRLKRKPRGFLPFRTWMAFCLIFNFDMPMSRRVYRGLALDDTVELDLLADYNLQSIDEYHSLPLPIHSLDPLPTFFLALLDLSHSTFSDSDLYKLNKLSPFLAALKLDGTQVTDDGIQKLMMAHGTELEEEGGQKRYGRLEILSLRGLKKVTDISAKKIRNLKSLRMLNLVETSATDAFMRILDARTPLHSNQARWSYAKYQPHKDMSIARGEPLLFSSNYSLSHNLTTLYTLASLHPRNIDNATPFPVQKPVCVQISDVIRSTRKVPLNALKTLSTEELYQKQLGLANNQPHSKAAYNPTYGSVTSTSSINTDLFRAAGAEYSEKGVAFRIRDESKAAGVWEDPNRGKISLFESGMRKVSTGGMGEGERDDAVLSDWGEEEDEEDRRRDEEEERRIEGMVVEMYKEEARERNERRKKRREELRQDVRIGALTLVRHLPLMGPFGERPLTEEERVVKEEGMKVEVKEREGLVIGLREGTALKKKRKIDHISSDLFDGVGTPSSIRTPSAPSSTSTSTSIKSKPNATWAPPTPSTSSSPAASTSSSRFSTASSPFATSRPLKGGNGTGISKARPVTGAPEIKNRRSLSVFRKAF